MRYSRTLVNYVLKERRTFFQELEALAEQVVSLQAVDAVVASPIFGIHDEVIGILYGARKRAQFGRLQHLDSVAPRQDPGRDLQEPSHLERQVDASVRHGLLTL